METTNGQKPHLRIIVDAYGGDNAPLEILRGAALAVAEYGHTILLTGNEADIRLVSRQENGVTVFRHRQGCSPQDFEGGVIPAVGVDDDPQMRFLSVCGFHGFATFLFIDPVQAGTGPGCPGHGGPGPRPAAACPGPAPPEGAIFRNWHPWAESPGRRDR